jgi:hypothetical protein
VTRPLAVAAVVVAVLTSTAAAAPEQVTIEARPTVVRWGFPVTLSGVVDSRNAGEVVTIQANDCGPSSQFFRELDTTRTREGGTWSHQLSPLINTTLRAVWNGNTSAPVVVRQRPFVMLRQKSRGRFVVSAWGKAGSSFWRKRLLFQRFDRRVGTWATVKRVVMTEYTGPTTFRASVPRRSRVRVVLPRSQARPCYLAGYSNLVQT